MSAAAAFPLENCIPTNPCLILGAGTYSHTIIICCRWNWILHISQLSNMIVCGRGLLTLWMVECLINLCNRKFSSARNVILVLIPESTNNQCSGQDNFLRKFKSLIQTGQREFFTFVVAMLSGTLSSASSNTFLHAEQYFNDTTGAQLRGWPHQIGDQQPAVSVL